MTELDLLLIRQREHEIAAMQLRWDRAMLCGSIPSSKASIMIQLGKLEEERIEHTNRLEQQGHDYFTITAEMARIRAEVRGEK